MKRRCWDFTPGTVRKGDRTLSLPGGGGSGWGGVAAWMAARRGKGASAVQCLLCFPLPSLPPLSPDTRSLTQVFK